MSFKITWKTHVKCFFISIAITILLYDRACLIVDNFMFSNLILYPFETLMLNFVIHTTLLIFLISIIHEFLHGFAFTVFGGKAVFGFKGIYAYTHEVSGIAIKRSGFITVLLLPLVIISAVSLSIGNQVAHMCFLINLLGSSGDIYMAANLCNHKKDCRVIDRSYGYDIIED